MIRKLHQSKLVDTFIRFARPKNAEKHRMMVNTLNVKT